MHLVSIAMLLLPVICNAEVQELSANGFSVRHTLHTDAATAVSWTVMTNHIDEWWNPEHSWSGSAENLYIEAKVGGCFCEHLQQGGGVEHLRIIYLNPGRELRFDGALGPLQTLAVQGRMVWQIEADETGSSITFLYRVHGYLEGGFEGIAPAVDGVIGEQLERLGTRLENR
jgi:hypothetical protein